jgi:hypothetical protein
MIMTILREDYVDEKTILEPYKTQFRTEGFIQDIEYLFSPNRYGEYSVSWVPLTHNDHQQLHEHLQGCVSEVQLSTSPYSRKVATPKYENDKGEFYSSQLFQTKVSINVEHPSELIGKTASFVGHVRDLPLGQIVLQLDYLDVDDWRNGIDEVIDGVGLTTNSEVVNLDDW